MVFMLQLTDMLQDNKKVLVAEDDVFLSQLLSTRLEKAGINVLKAFDGEEALNLIKKERPDLILLDIILPKKSGFEVAEEVASNPMLRTIPIIITSNLGQDSDVERGIALGVVEYLVKAKINIEDLVAKVQVYLDKPNIVVR
jgi:DNA-binding response OmpR family regulator